jgi:hypothetical protein
MRSLIFRLLAATWLAVLVAPASGAEIRRGGITEFKDLSGLADVILEGKIQTVTTISF